MIKKLILTSLSMFFLATACKKEKTVQVEELAYNSYSPEFAENAVIYEANIRQYSPEGNFNAFTKDIPELKKLGVKIIWVMPIQPISMKNRKTTDGRLVEEITDPDEKKKHLGSYYSIADYTAVNSDYGNLEDFKKLVETAHENGMLVILDWVANHTGWGHKWIQEHPEFYHKNAKGEITDPLNPETGESWGWTDVAHLNYDADGLFEAMTNEMLYWVKETDIDGFRCDVADNVKLDFWEFVYPKLNEVKPVFMLMESNKPEYLKSIFDMGYNWQLHHLMNEIAQGKKKVSDLDQLIIEQDSIYQKQDIWMNFTSNHDENAWNGTEYERLGEAVETFAALTYTIPGMPLIYNGQEYDFDKRLKFFEKDTITHTKGKMFSVYEKLGQLKNENPALNGGVNKASYERIQTSDNENIFAFQREKDGKKVYYIANLSKEPKKFSLPLSGEFENYMSSEKITLTQNQELEFQPWEYWILVD